MTVVELCRLLPGRSPQAVRYARMRFGRYNRALVPLDGLCIACDSRPVWSESRHAHPMHLCKECYLEEMERRAKEEARANAQRQRIFKRNAKGPGSR